MEHKSTPTEFKALPDGSFEGYASTFESKDSYGDIVKPGAFKKTLLERSSKVKILWNHNPMQPIGKPLSMLEDTAGLLVQGRTVNTPLGNEVMTLIREGVITEMSIGYTPIKYTYRDGDEYGRDLLELKLYEFSPVTFPANESALITGVKSMSELEGQIRQWKNIAAVDFKAGAVLSGANAKRVLAALQELQALLSEAGLEPESAASDGTETSLESQQEKATEPDDFHSSVLTALQSFKKSTLEQKFLSEFRALGASLQGGN